MYAYDNMVRTVVVDDAEYSVTVVEEELLMDNLK